MRNVDRDATSTSATAAEAPTSELRGSVLDVARALRDENDWDAILEIVGKLVAENADMSRRLARIASRFKTSEKIGRAQLVLLSMHFSAARANPRPTRQRQTDPTSSTTRTRSCAPPPASTTTRTAISGSSRRGRRVSRRIERPRLRTCVASTTRFWCPPRNARVLGAERSERASATTSRR